jgi:hypothetical protein
VAPLANGEIGGRRGTVSATVLRGVFAKISCRFKLSRTCPLTLAPTEVLITLELYRFLLFDFSISSALLNREGARKASSALLLFGNSTATCLHILLALLLALSSSSNSFVRSYPLVLQSTLHCPQLLLSFNLCSTPLLLVLSCRHHCFRRYSTLCAAIKYASSSIG